MNNIYQFIKNIKLKRILTVLFASSLLMVSTACNSNDVSQAKSAVTSATADTYDKYDREESYKGGMNGYNDDPRYNTDAGAAAKAKALVDNAKSRKVDSLGEFVDKVGERSVLNEDVNEKATKAFSRKVERNKDKALDYVDNKSDKLKRNLSNAPDEAKKAFDGAVDTAQDAVEDAEKATKSTAKNIKGNFKDLT